MSCKRKETVIPPESLLKAWKAESRLLLGPGPSDVPYQVATAGALPMISHSDPSFYKLIEEIKEGIRYVFQTKNEVSFCITGSGHTGMEAAISNILNEGDTLLVIGNSFWGQRAAQMGINAKASVIKVEPRTFGEVVNLDAIENSLEKNKPTLMYVCHGDSSLGTLQPLEGIGAACLKHGCLLLVDAVASLLAAPLPMDEFLVDVLFSGSQKCLNSPTGLALVSFSERAMKLIDSRQPRPVYYLDVVKMSSHWNCRNSGYIYHSTPAISLLQSLREALAIVARNGIYESISQQNKISKFLQVELEKLGLEFLAKPENRLPSVLAIKVPKNIDGNAVRSYLLTHYNIEIVGGIGPSVGLVWRIGLMGQNATRKNCALLITALAEAINAPEITKEKL